MDEKSNADNNLKEKTKKIGIPLQNQIPSMTPNETKMWGWGRSKEESRSTSMTA